MNFRTFAAILIILVLIPAAMAAYSAFKHGAFTIGDGKDINLFGNRIGNGSVQDVVCASNCSNFNVTSTETNASNLTSGTVANARLMAAVANFNDSYSYLIYTDGTTTYAKNGSSGNIDYSGTNAGIVINSATNHSAGGGNIKIAAGTYNITTPIKVQNGVSYIGNGYGTNVNGTFLNGSSNIFNLTDYGNTDHVKISGFSFRGTNVTAINQSNMSLYSLIEITDNSFQAELKTGLRCNCILSSVYNNWFGYYGTPGTYSNHIYMLGTATQSVNENYITRNRFYRANGSDGSISLDTGYKILIEENDFETNTATPIIIKGMYSTYILRNWFETNTATSLINYSTSGAIGNYVNLISQNYFNSGTGQVRWFNIANGEGLNIEFNTFTGADLAYTNDDTKINYFRQNLYTQYTGAQTEENKLVQSGSYSGNDAANRGIPHNLGVIPKAVRIIKNANPDTYDIMQPGAIHWQTSNNANARAVTAADSTNFYVGNSADYNQTANGNGASYWWTAWG